jgi:hypothetical protein
MAQALNSKGIFTTSDLMRSNRTALAAAIGATVDDVRGWQSFAQLTEIGGISGEGAARLLAAGIDQLDEFCGKTVAELRAALTGLTSPMTDDQIVEALISARKLQFTGVLNGTVVTSGDVPLEGATVVAGGQIATSDARGRFRVTGLRLGQKYSVALSHRAKKAKIFNRVDVYPSLALVGRKFRLTGRPEVERRRSALNGDVLPPLGTAPVTSEAQTGSLAPNDKFVLAEFYANGDAKLASLFLDFHDGRFVVRTYRVRKADLPARAALRDRMEVVNGKLTIAKITAGKIGRLTRARAVMSRYKGKQLTGKMLEEASELLLKALIGPK